LRSSSHGLQHPAAVIIKEWLSSRAHVLSSKLRALPSIRPVASAVVVESEPAACRAIPKVEKKFAEGMSKKMLENVPVVAPAEHYEIYQDAPMQVEQVEALEEVGEETIEESDAAWDLLEEAQQEAEEVQQVPATSFDALAALQEGEHVGQVAAEPTTEVLHLPEPWQMHLNEEHAVYFYYNPITGESQWQMPGAW